MGRAIYWLCIGWWWAPLALLGRLMLWLLWWPVGLWRSIVKGQKRRARKAQRLAERDAARITTKA